MNINLKRLITNPNKEYIIFLRIFIFLILLFEFTKCKTKEIQKEQATPSDIDFEINKQLITLSDSGLFEHCPFLITCENYSDSCMINFYSPFQFFQLKSKPKIADFTLYNSEVGIIEIRYFSENTQNFRDNNTLKYVKNISEEKGHKRIEMLNVYPSTLPTGLSCGYSYNCLNNNNELISINHIALLDTILYVGWSINFEHKLSNIWEEDKISKSLIKCILQSFSFHGSPKSNKIDGVKMDSVKRIRLFR